jgi:soluble lytic murein transglycosylase-like protein
LGNNIKRILIIVVIIFLIFFFLVPKIGVSNADKVSVRHTDSSESVLIANLPLPKPTPRQLVVVYANKYGVDVQTALEVIACESEFNPAAQNPKSSAGGMMQFIDGTWNSVNRIRGTGWTLADKYDVDKNLDNGMWLVQNEGWHHWECYHV